VTEKRLEKIKKKKKKKEEKDKMAHVNTVTLHCAPLHSLAATCTTQHIETRAMKRILAHGAIHGENLHYM